MVDVEEVEVVVAHRERATLRVGDVFLKVDADQTRTDVEVEAMALAPIPTPQVLWRKPPVVALAALSGSAPGRLGEPSTASSAAWAAAGAAARTLHDAPLPPWPGRSREPLQLLPSCSSKQSSGDRSGRQRRKRAACLSQRLPSRTVYATSHTAVGGTRRQVGTAACCHRDRIGLSSGPASASTDANCG